MKLNKTFALTLVLLALCAFTCKEQKRIEKITFYYVGVEVETPFQVSCSDFENLFSGSYKTVVVKDSNQLKEFANYLAHCDVSDSAKNIDVRVKAIIAYPDGKTSVLCMNRFNDILLDNRLIKENKSIISFIRKQIKE